nr:CotO family spore coat protein [Amphibacillus sp. MSJ-3]
MNQSLSLAKEKNRIQSELTKENVIDTETSVQSSDQDLSPKTTDRFDQMTIEEKVCYLAKPSSFLPRMNCKISINNTKYRGKVLALEKSQVVFEETSSAKRHNFDLKDIDDLKLLGF